jgi:hypothetical protein
MIDLEKSYCFAVLSGYYYKAWIYHPCKIFFHESPSYIGDVVPGDIIKKNPPQIFTRSNFPSYEEAREYIKRTYRSIPRCEMKYCLGFTNQNIYTIRKLVDFVFEGV